MGATTNTLEPGGQKPSRFREITDSLKALADAGKAIFFSVLLLLLFIPPVTKRLLAAYGLQISEVSSKDGIVLKQIEQSQKDAKAAGAAIASNQQQLPQVNDALKSILGQVTNPKVKEQLSAAIEGVDQAVANNAQAVSSVGSTIVNQSQAYQSAATSSVRASGAPSTPTEGWLYLGRVDANQKAWLENGPLSIVPVSLPLSQGQTLTLAGPALIRGDAGTGQHANAPVVSALPRNSRLLIEALEPSHAKNGDYFMWVKVREGS